MSRSRWRTAERSPDRREAPRVAAPDAAAASGWLLGGPGSFLWPAVIIFGVAFALRLLHLWQMSDSPFASVLMGDAKGYDTWARQIAAGDWIGRDVFYQAPLYPYFMGALYSVFGPDPSTLRICQALVGSLSCALVGTAGVRFFSPRIGLIAGLSLAFYAPAIFFDGLIQKSVLDVFFVCVALALLGTLARNSGRSEDRPLQESDARVARSIRDQGFEARLLQRIRRGRSLDRREEDPPVALRWPWLALGVTVGCLSLTRENALVLILVIGIWAFLRVRHAAARIAPTLALFLAGVAIVLFPVAARNYAVGGGLYLTTSQFGPNFYIGNNPEADGTYMSLRFGRGSPEYERLDATELAERALDRSLSPGEVSSYWTGQALEFISSDPAAWLRLQARKTALLLNATEMLDTESQEAHAEYSWPLRVLGPLTHFGVLIPLAVFGVIATWPERRRLWVLYAVGLTYAVSTVMFFVFARYRYPLVPVLLLFAAAGLVGLLETGLAGLKTGRSRGSRAVATTLAAVAAAAIIANWPMLSTDLMRAITNTNVGTAYYEQQRLDEAASWYRKALATRPDYVPAYNNLGVTLRAQGRVDEAIVTYQEGLQRRADYPDLHYNLANALMERGQPDAAADHLRVASKSLPDAAGVHNNLGKALAEQGQLSAAASELRKALELEPESAKAHRNLGNVLASQGRLEEALMHVRRAVEIDTTDPDARYDLGSLLLEAGRIPEAVESLTEAVRLSPASAEARNNLGIALASGGNLAEAVAQWERAMKLRPDFEDARRNLETARNAGRPRSR